MVTRPRAPDTPPVGYASLMRLHQNGLDLAEVSCLERRGSEPAGGPELLWFTVLPNTPVNRDAPAELVGETNLRITVVDYHSDDGLVVALTEPE